MTDAKTRARRARRALAEKAGQAKAARQLGDALAESEAARARAVAMLSALLGREDEPVTVTLEEVERAIHCRVHVEAVEGGVRMSLTLPLEAEGDLPSAEAP